MDLTIVEYGPLQRTRQYHHRTLQKFKTIGQLKISCGQTKFREVWI